MRRIIAATFWIASAFGQTPVKEPQWIEAKSAHYSVFYQSGFEDDVTFARVWLDRAEELLKQKYGVPFTGFRVSLYLYAAPTQNAKVGIANLHCCSNTPGGEKTGTISYLAPSAPVWRDSPGRTSLGLPKDDNFHAKVILSECITVGHYVVQESRAGTGGWKYYSAPEWFVQGLQEYDGIFHTTDANREVTKSALFSWARSHSSAFECCASGLRITDAYNGGAAFMAFLAAQFGEDVHAKLLKSTAGTFDAALEQQTKPYSLPELFAKFHVWLAGTETPPQ